MTLPDTLRPLALLLLLGPAARPALAQNPLAAPAPTVAGRALFAGSLTPRLVARQFGFTEGPAVDKAGNIFFTDQPNDKIWQYDTRGKLSVFMSPAGRANGLYFDKQGNLLACADGPNQLWAIAPTTRQVTVLAQRTREHPYNGPNDVWVNSKTEGVYFTDPYYQREYWPASHPGSSPQYVYYLAPGAAAPVPLDTTLQKPNGLIGSPDGRLLYVADIEAGKTYRYHLGRQGEVLDREVFVEQGSDG
ncbi:MAG: SMP-30/gluconolactonase/LRE family protein, partial [Hymenobacter sp.]